MSVSFLTNLNEEEFKSFLREALTEILSGQNLQRAELPEILDIRQASSFLKLKVNTLYEKTSEKTIPHFKKGNKLYFNLKEITAWLMEGKVKTKAELQAQAITYRNRKNHDR